MTENQIKYIASMSDKTLTIADGCAGVGKSFLAVALTLEHLLEQKIDKILICRSMIDAGSESKGFPALPGELNNKIHPYMSPYTRYLEYFLDKKTIRDLIQTEKIELSPVELIRGHTYGHKRAPAVMILEEAQNCTPKQIKLFLTRLGKGSRAIIAGDQTQSDLYGQNGLDFILNTIDLSDLNDVGIVNFTYQDIQRNKIIGHIIQKFDEKNV